MSDNNKFLYVWFGFLAFVVLVFAMVAIFAPPETAKAFMGVK